MGKKRKIDTREAVSVEKKAELKRDFFERDVPWDIFLIILSYLSRHTFLHVCTKLNQSWHGLLSNFDALKLVTRNFLWEKIQFSCLKKTNPRLGYDPIFNEFLNGIGVACSEVSELYIYNKRGKAIGPHCVRWSGKCKGHSLNLPEFPEETYEDGFSVVLDSNTHYHALRLCLSDGLITFLNIKYWENSILSHIFCGDLARKNKIDFDQLKRDLPEYISLKHREEVNRIIKCTSEWECNTQDASGQCQCQLYEE